jgi:hypothetical protein
MLSRFAIGGNLEFTKTLAAYPASAGWVLSYRLVLKSGTGHLTFDAAADGDVHAVAVAAATTAAWTPGDYTWFSWVTLGAAVHNVETGETTLLPNPRTATASLDLRSDAQTALDNVRATIRGTASANVLSYAISGRQLQHYSIQDLIVLESKLARAVQRETQALTGRNPRRLVARVSRA